MDRVSRLRASLARTNAEIATLEKRDALSLYPWERGELAALRGKRDAIESTLVEAQGLSLTGDAEPRV